MVLIVCAMDSEANEIKKELTDLEIINITKGKYYYKGKINKKDVALIITGVGKVNAAIMTAAVLERHDFSYVLNIGLAGSFSPNQIGDVIVVKDASYHDVDVSSINPLYEKGQVPNMPHPFLSDEILVRKFALKLEGKLNSLYTGDQFVTAELSKPKGVYDMEGAAIYQTCYIYDKKVISVKVVSDIVDSTEQKRSYIAFEENAATLIKDLVLKVI